MNLQHVNAILLVRDPEAVDLERVIPVFHGWIQEHALEETLLDVADYRHVPAGPGVVLIGHEANYSLDNADGQLGVRYNRKAPLDGSVQNRLEQAVRSALHACRLLENDPRLQGKIRFHGRSLELSVNDRLLAPNTAATRRLLEPEIRAFCSRLFAGKKYSLDYDGEPRRLFSVQIGAAQEFTAGELLGNLVS
jgi:hypothetical protein